MANTYMCIHVHVFVDRRVFAWGRCDYGQLGLDIQEGDSRRGISIPTEVKSLHDIKQVSFIHTYMYIIHVCMYV